MGYAETMVAPNEMFGEACPASAPFFGYMGAASALIFANLGAAYGTAKSVVGICSMGIMHPQLIMKSIIPVVMAGVIGIYGFIIAVVVGTGIKEPSGGGAAMAVPQYTLFRAFGHLGSGLTGGLSGVRATAQQPKLFVGMILILIFAEALGLY